MILKHKHESSSSFVPRLAVGLLALGVLPVLPSFSQTRTSAEEPVARRVRSDAAPDQVVAQSPSELGGLKARHADLENELATLSTQLADLEALKASLQFELASRASQTHERADEELAQYAGKYHGWARTVGKSGAQHQHPNQRTVEALQLGVQALTREGDLQSAEVLAELIDVLASGAAWPPGQRYVVGESKASESERDQRLLRLELRVDQLIELMGVHPVSPRGTGAR